LEQDKKILSSTKDVDDDERDGHKMGEIMRRMEDRKATKELDIARKWVTDTRSPAPVACSKITKEL